jgi:hypothetical protein
MPEVDPFFAELEAEIEQATKASRLKSDAAALKKQALNMRLSTRERQRAAEEYKSLQTIIDATLWQPLRAGALFTEQTCDGCGSVHYNFLQYMQEECRVAKPADRRWIRVGMPMDGLPTDTILQPLKTHICSDCCTDHGFDVNLPNIRLMPRGEALTVSPTYVQGDINDPSQEN